MHRLARPRLGLWILIVAIGLAPTEARADESASSLVKITTMTNPWDWAMPWQRLGTTPMGGSGVILENGYILTNAHVVDAAVGIEVKREGTSKTYAAKLAWLQPSCDLALVKVENEGFAAGVSGLPLGPMPEVGEQVVVHGYPMGGDALSTTAGVVSRIEMTMNFYSLETVLSVQIDAALNPGNSGGPVLSNGKIVGIASALLEDADGVGFMVPTPVIRHFLEDIEDGTLDGLPILEVGGQLLESAALRGSLGLAAEAGVLVNRVAYGSSAWGALQAGDVLLEFNGYPIGIDGTVESEYGTRLDYYYLVRNRQVGETVGVKLWRDGEVIEREITLNQQGLRALTSHQEPRPSYRIFAGLLFQPMSYDYLMLFGDTTPPGIFYCASHEILATEDRREWILLNQILPHEVNRGYQDWSDLVVSTVDGRIPLDMDDLNRILDTAQGPWLEFRFLDGDAIVLDLAAARAADAEILENFGVGSGRYPAAQTR